jgi:hypothetical protein
MFVYIYHTTAAGSSSSSQLGSFYQGNRYDTEKAGGAARPSRTKSRGGHRHLQRGRMLDIDLISEPSPPPPPPDVCIQSVGICVATGAGSDS